MLSRNQMKLLRSLQRKKDRQQERLFVVEGGKPVAELLASNWPLHSLYLGEDFAAAHAALLQHTPVTLCSAEELTAAGTLASNRDAIAIARMPDEAPTIALEQGEWVLALDRINDPGNLGTLLRIADWYGIRCVVCSPDTVELYNPKVISASMGSFLRVSVHYQPLADWLADLPTGTQVLGAYLQGESVHALPAMDGGGVLLMGSEAHGIAPQLTNYVTRQITIPAFGAAESLNVAVATAIICDNLRRTGRH